MSWDPLNCGKKNKRENKKEKRVEEISQDERKIIREEERSEHLKYVTLVSVDVDTTWWSNLDT